jgi:hypothetical protein
MVVAGLLAVVMAIVAIIGWLLVSLVTAVIGLLG